MRQTLRVGAAVPDPPFNSSKHGGGLDTSMMSAIGEVLGVVVQFVPFTGADFNEIFDVLNTGGYDCVTAGTTVTPGRQQMAAFCAPYLISGQSLAVDIKRLPDVRSIDDLGGLTIGVQQGNTSQPIAERLVAQGKAKAVRVYDYSSVRTAIDDLTSDACDAFMKLAPVLTELVRAADGVAVVQRGLSTEQIATAVRLSDTELLQRINAAQAELEQNGILPALRQTWLGATQLDQSKA